MLIQIRFQFIWQIGQLGHDSCLNEPVIDYSLPFDPLLKSHLSALYQNYKDVSLYILYQSSYIKHISYDYTLSINILLLH